MSEPRSVFIALCLLVPGIAGAGLGEDVSNAGGGGTSERPVSMPTGAEVVAAKESSAVTVRASRSVSFTEDERDGVQRAKFTLWSAAASAPLNKSGGDTTVTSIDGLANTASVELKYSNFTVPGKRSARAMARYKEKLDDICKRTQEAAKAAGQAGDCDDFLVSKFGSGDDLYQFVSAFWDPRGGTSRIWGLSAKLGYQNYEYVDSATATKGKQDETPWSLGIFGALNPDDWRAVISLGFQYQRAYKEGTSGTICPASTGGTVACVTAAVDKPKQVTKKILSLEARKEFAGIAAGLTANRDFEARVWGLEIPVYFLKDKDGKFIGGAKAAWRSDTHDFGVSVFVGSAFGLF